MKSYIEIGRIVLIAVLFLLISITITLEYRGPALLCTFAWHGNQRGIDTLLRLGVDINAEAKVTEFWMPREFLSDYMRMADLMKKGPEEYHRDTTNPLRTAIIKISMEYWEDGRENDRSKDPPLETISYLLDRGANPNSIDSVIYEVMQVPKLTRLLLERGADVKIFPLSAGMLTCPYKTFEILLQHGADVNATGHKFAPDTGPALLVASLGRDIKIVELLLSYGADVNKASNWGTTPLQGASGENTPEVVERLLKAGAHINASDIEGDTPLHRAANSYKPDREKVVSMLLAKGFDVNARNKKGQTPLALAVKRDNKKVVELLHRHGGKE